MRSVSRFFIISLLFSVVTMSRAQDTLRISRLVMASQVESSPAAVYPVDAKAAGIEGTVVLDVVISKTGAVEQAIVRSGPDKLRDAAKDAVSKWSYNPYLLDGVATEVKTTVRVEFILSGTDHVASTRNASADEKEIQPNIPAGGSRTPSAIGTLRVSSGIAGQNKLSGTVPAYPSQAKAAGVSGAVILHAIISETGKIETLSVLLGPDMLRQPAMDAVYTWKYKPFLKNDQPVKVETTITVNYSFAR